MTASDYIKDHGLPSLAHVARMINRHPDTIRNWYNNPDDFELFQAAVAWCMHNKEIIGNIHENKELLDIQD